MGVGAHSPSFPFRSSGRLQSDLTNGPSRTHSLLQTGPAVKRIVKGTDPKAELRIWLRLHTLRLITADIPALVVFSKALLAK